MTFEQSQRASAEWLKLGVRVSAQRVSEHSERLHEWSSQWAGSPSSEAFFVLPLESGGG